MKKLYTSYGTYGFLNQIKINNPSHHLFQFSTADSSVIFEETEENTVLKSPSIYEVIKEIGAFNEDHFYCAIFIPSTEDHVYQLEKKLISVDDNFKNFGGFKSYRLLRPVKVQHTKFTLALLIDKLMKTLKILMLLKIIFQKKH